MFSKAIILALTATALTIEQASAAGAADFTYDPTTDKGPADWKDLVYEDGTDNQCGGQSNSPIAVQPSTCDKFEDYTFSAGTCTTGDFGFTINHHAEQVNAPSADVCEVGTMQIPGDDATWDMLQFHIHMNSEHTFNGNFYGAEIHIVHTERGGDRLAVLGMFITPKAQESNDIFAHLLNEWDNLTDDTYRGCNKTVLPHWWKNAEDNLDSFSADALDAYDLIPEGSTMYTYDGGLTTPPCSEVVEWNVVDKPIEITVSQFNDLSSLVLNYVSAESCEFATIADPKTGSTSRPPVALNGREVTRICPEDFVEPQAASGSPSALESNSTSTTSGAVAPGVSAVAALLGAAALLA